MTHPEGSSLVEKKTVITPSTIGYLVEVDGKQVWGRIVPLKKHTSQLMLRNAESDQERAYQEYRRK